MIRLRQFDRRARKQTLVLIVCNGRKDELTKMSCLDDRAWCFSEAVVSMYKPPRNKRAMMT